MAVLAVIPSRFASKRLPGKALLPIHGIPLVRRVAMRVIASGVADVVIVATDDSRIADVVNDLDVHVVLSDCPCRSGSDRVAAAARSVHAEHVLNVQGDEAFVDEVMLRAALQALGSGDLGTVATDLDSTELDNPHVVKVWVDEYGRALNFSRTCRNDLRLSESVLKHIGVYAFHRASLERFTALPTSIGERRERLEQLRAQEHGWCIHVAHVASVAHAVDTLCDLEQLNKLLDRMPENPTRTIG